ncbi:P-loop containing nucleoside triphosphate hydrolase protein [Cantharellus anzutake]|uniref:P-loop containing nucleoside triphosphate hydrolase protein n=1 Tax=Cantharellus anzutake TaxID=1750568 RepID=UPI001907ADA3|nr:P-loop containing nucleoside triphosphate hydrolase protein [Cantharellus anzutake]KAF8341274.1 P-loop containing nucleoside triphosphate hydrolase protein [Cantharellus anzutake]
MPRIRKRTSRRQTTRERSRFHHKINESRRKERKLAKKNPQWKSRHPKDPGIPSSLPFKDQVLAEVAEESRRNQEEKRLRKLQKKDASHNEPEEGSGDEYEERDISSTVEIEEPEPLLYDPSIPHLAAALEKADVWLYVMDARDPSVHRNLYIERLAIEKAKKIIFLMNKADLCPREVLQKWLSYFRATTPSIPVIPFRVSSSYLPIHVPHASAPKGIRLGQTDAIGIKELLDRLNTQTAATSSGPVTVAVIGLSNSGKSSVINSLLGAGRLEAYEVNSTKLSSMTTTILPQPVQIKRDGVTLNFIDTPGFAFQGFETLVLRNNVTFQHVRDSIVRCRGQIEKMVNAHQAGWCLRYSMAPLLTAKLGTISVLAKWIISRSNPQDLIVHYNTPAFMHSSPSSFLTGLARVTGHRKKGGAVPDAAGAARSLLCDWRMGKFPYYTHPPAYSAPSSGPFSLTTESDDQLLSSFLTREELEKHNFRAGLIRLDPVAPEERSVNLEFVQTFETREPQPRPAKIARSLAGRKRVRRRLKAARTMNMKMTKTTKILTNLQH